MIKKIIAVFFVMFIFSGVALSMTQEVIIDSQPTRINIYPNTGMIIRETEVELGEGFHKIVFDNILETFDERTINAELKGISEDAISIRNVSIEKVLLEVEPSIEIRQLKEEIVQLEKEIRLLISKKDTLKDKKGFLDSIIYYFQNQDISSDYIIQMPAVEQFERIYDFLDEKLKSNYEEELNYDLEIESLQEKIVFLEKQLQQIIDRQIDTKVIVTIELDVYKKSNPHILISYLVDNEISWRPAYDIRANINENSITIFTYALINQSTGTNWEDVYISLSTARPTVSGIMPTVEPWFLKPFQLEQRDSKMVQTPIMEEYALEAVSGDSMYEKNIVPVEHKGTSVTYNIPHKISVLSGNRQEKMLISEEELTGNFQYKAYPKESPFVYYNVSLKNNMDIPLLPGEANLFLEGGYVGNSSIDYIPTGEDFEVSLGIAENVRIQRKLIRKYVDETLIASIPSSKIATKYEYKIVLENYQDSESLCQIFENIPIPADDRIQVNIEDISLEPDIKDWDDKKGVWMWEVLLQPKEKIEINIGYTVIHPRDLQVIDLP